MLIRRLTENNVRDASRLYYECIVNNYTGTRKKEILNEYNMDKFDQILFELEEDGKQIYLGYLDEILGVIIIDIESNEILSIMVDKDMRSIGYGDKFLNLGLKKLNMDKIVKIFAFEFNGEGQRFYENKRFEATGNKKMIDAVNNLQQVEYFCKY